MHGDRADAHRPVEQGGAGALRALCRPRRTLKERKLALGPNFTPAYRQYLREYKPKTHLFGAPRAMSNMLADLAALAGLVEGVSFEQLRWTSGVRDYRNGIPPERLREKLGIYLISWHETLPKIQKLANPAL